MSATNHPVVVVPTFDPKMSQRELVKLSIPALTKPIARSVVAVEDWSIVVARTPEKNHFKRVSVIFSKNFTKNGHDVSLSPSESVIIP